MKIWQKNYDIDKAIEHFTVGKDRLHDLRLAWFDVIGSMAHIKMLNDINLISDIKNFMYPISFLIFDIYQIDFFLMLTIDSSDHQASDHPILDLYI